MVGQYAGNLPRTNLRGTWEHLLLPRSPANRPGPGPGPASMVGQAASAAPQPVRMPSGGPGLASTLVRATHGQRSTIPARQARFGQRRPSRAPTTATRPTRCANVAGPAAPTDSGIQHGPHSAAAAAVDTGRVSVRTPGSHRSCGHQAHGHRTHGHRTRGHRTSTRPVGRTSVRMADSGREQSDERRGRRPDILDGTTTATAGWAAKARSGCRVCGARQPHNAAAVTGQLRSTTRHEAAPRRTAVVCWIWMVREEGNGTTERCGVRGQVGREC